MNGPETMLDILWISSYIFIIRSPYTQIIYGLDTGTSLVAQLVKNLPAMQVTRVRSLGWQDPLEKEMATLSSILAWKIPWTEEPGGLQSTGSQRVRHDWVTNIFTFIFKGSLETDWITLKVGTSPPSEVQWWKGWSTYHGLDLSPSPSM